MKSAFNIEESSCMYSVLTYVLRVSETTILLKLKHESSLRKNKPSFQYDSFKQKTLNIFHTLVMCLWWSAFKLLTKCEYGEPASRTEECFKEVIGF